MENIQETLHHQFAAPLAEIAVNITIENLREITSAQLDRLATYQNTIGSLSDAINIDELMQRYKAKKSYFAIASDWFGKQHLWQKALIGAAFVGVSYLLSLSFILTGIVYIAIAFLMENHYKTSQEQEELIEEDLLHLKQSLVDSIQHLDGVSSIIQRTLSALCALNTELADINSKLEENNTDLEREITRFKRLVLALEKNKDELLSSTATLKSKLDTAYAKIHRHEEEMSAGAQSIRESDRSLGETCSGFKTSLERFDEFTREQQASIVEYERLSAKLKEKIAEYEQALSILPQNHHLITSTMDYAQSEFSHDHALQKEADLSIMEGHLLCDRLEQELAKKTNTNYSTYDLDDGQTERRRAFSCGW
ncbi:MAG: hypothetical protein CK423_07690 [Legionella sp.]|nr:MAG: hypothetical protein CK423_07690 [Legionella sp.]